MPTDRRYPGPDERGRARRHEFSEPRQPGRRRSRRRGHRSSALIIVICVLAAAVVLLTVLLLLPRQPAAPSQPQGPRAARDPNAAVGQIKEKTREEIIAELNKVVEEGMFNISINSAITFPSGDAEGDVRIENIAANHLLMRVEIARDDTGEVIYTTDVIEPGYHIQNDKLDTPLPKGVYPCTAMFSAIDPDTEQKVGQAGAKVTITVEK